MSKSNFRRSTTIKAPESGSIAAAGGRSVHGRPTHREPEVVREGVQGDTRRDSFDALDARPAAIDWSLLTDQERRCASTAESLKDKVVVVIFWSSWHQQQGPGSPACCELAEANKDNAVIIAAHNDTRYEGAAKVLADAAATVLATSPKTRATSPASP